MVIGITGGIGSGKSTIAAELRRLGYRVYDTDSGAKRIIVQDSAVRSRLSELLGADIYDYLDNQYIYRTDVVATRVFADPRLLAGLNAIVHPAVKRDIESVVKQMPQGEILFIESALLYDAGLDRICDRVVLVTAPEPIRIQRTIARDHTQIDKVRARIRAQKYPSEDTEGLIVLHNDGSTSIDALTALLLHSLK